MRRTDRQPTVLPATPSSWQTLTASSRRPQLPAARCRYPRARRPASHTARPNSRPPGWRAVPAPPAASAQGVAPTCTGKPFQLMLFITPLRERARRRRTLQRRRVRSTCACDAPPPCRAAAAGLPFFIVSAGWIEESPPFPLAAVSPPAAAVSRPSPLPPSAQERGDFPGTGVSDFLDPPRRSVVHVVTLSRGRWRLQPRPSPPALMTTCSS